MARPLGGGATHHSLRWGAPAICLGLAACLFSHKASSPLAGYHILIESHDSLSNYLARALERKGFSVRRSVTGEAPATAGLITFTFPGEPPARQPWLAVRLADTRTGAVLAAVSAPMDSLAPGAAARAAQLADSLAARLAPP